MDKTRIDWQWPAATVFSVACATLGFLVYSGKLHPEILTALLTWLAPGPWTPKTAASEPAPPQTPSGTSESNSEPH